MQQKNPICFVLFLDKDNKKSMGDKQKTFRLNRHTHTHTHKRSPPVVNKSCWHGWLNEIVNKKKNTITRIDIHPRYCGSIGLVSLVVVVVVFAFL